MTPGDRSVRVGDVLLPGGLFLAPVAGYSDAAFRSVCVSFGADLCYTEMVSSEALTRGHTKTGVLLARVENEVRFAVQLFGADPSVLARATALVAPLGPVLIDLNCGCPVPKIVRTGAGSALGRNPGRIRDLVRAMRDACDVPVTVKIRTGWDDGSINYREQAAAAVEGGAAAVTLHARTRAQGYSGEAAWDTIALLVRELPVPVFGSGDVFSHRDVTEMLGRTGCAGVMIARGAIGNPFVFAEARAVLEGSAIPEFDGRMRAGTALRHLDLSIRFMGGRTACVEFRKQYCAYTKGVPGGAGLRARAVQASTREDYLPLFEAWADLDFGRRPAGGHDPVGD